MRKRLIVIACALVVGIPAPAYAHNDAGMSKWQSARILKSLEARGWAKLDRDSSFHRVARLSGAYWGVSYQWLHNCAHSEGVGITGPHVILWNDNWAGAGGPWQYLDGTFSSFSRQAWGAMKKRNLHVPARYRSKGSLVGQALTTGWAFRNGLSYHWYGAGC